MRSAGWVVLAVLWLVAPGCTAPPAASVPQPTSPSTTASVATTAPSSAPSTTEGGQALLAFEWYAGRDVKDVVIMRQDGTGRRALAADIEPDKAHAVVDWAPDGRTIAFVVYSEWYEGTSIWTVGVDGQEATQLIGPSDECRLGVNFPAYSPDGASLMYVCQDGLSSGDPNLVGKLTVLDLASRQTREVVTVHLPDELLYPRWSRDGLTAVFELFQWDTEPVEDVWTGSQVATVPISGGEIERLTPSDMWAGDPDWNPTSDVIVFGTYGILVKDMSKPSTIYTMQPDGSNQTVIAESAGNGLTRITGPRWAPDGQRLLISVAEGEDMQVNDVGLAFLELDGTVTRIPHGAGVGARLQPTTSR